MSQHSPYLPTDEDIDREAEKLGLSEDARSRLKAKVAEARARVDQVESQALSPNDIDQLSTELSPDDIARIREKVDAAWPSAVAFAHTIDPRMRSRRLLMAYPQTLFRPEGLWLWGADETTIVHDMKVGNLTGFTISHVPLPGLFFQAGLSFKEFEALLESPPENWSHARLRERPDIPSHQKIRLNVAEIGNNIVLDVEGPLTHAVMWGKSVH